MFNEVHSMSDVCRWANVGRSRAENRIQRGVLKLPATGATLATAEQLAVLEAIANSMRENPAQLREISELLGAAIEYELSLPRGGWSDTRTLHRCWGRARAGEEAWLVILATSSGFQIEPFESFEAASVAIRAGGEVGAEAVRVLALHRILAGVGERYASRNDRLEKVGAGMFVLHRADGSQQLLEEVEELEA